MTMPMPTTADALLDAIEAAEAYWRDLDETADVVELWLALDGARAALVELVKLVADDASSRLLDRDDPRAEYVTPHGDVTHLAPGYASERWRGHDLLTDQLAQPMAALDVHTGELGVMVAAVPLSILLDVLPGCTDVDSTSSRWRTTGLTRWLGPDWRRYRARDAAPLVIRRGAPL